MLHHNSNNDEPPALANFDEDIDDEDSDDDDFSHTDTSESISVDSDTLVEAQLHHHDSGGEVVIHQFNKLMGQGIAEEEEDDDDDDSYSENNVEDDLSGDQKRRRGLLKNGHDSFNVALGEPIIVPLNTGSDDEDKALVDDSPRKRPGRRLSRTKEEALERNMIRRQSSNEMLLAMQQAARSASIERDLAEELVDDEDGSGRKPPPRTRSGERLQRQPPPRTKSGEVRIRRPPTRTKSGEAGPAGGNGFTRQAPARTKSGEFRPPTGAEMDAADAPASTMSRLQRARESRLAVQAAAAVQGDFFLSSSNHDDGEAVLLSPSGRRRRGVEKEMALKRNAARRQKSSDMLGAMRDATRSVPARAKSSMAALERRAPARTKSGAANGVSAGVGLDAMVLPLNEGDEPRRRPPPRTKSGDGTRGQLKPGGRGVPVRRAPARTTSGSVLKPMQEEIEELE
jgi:hypothetical protein